MNSRTPAKAPGQLLLAVGQQLVGPEAVRVVAQGVELDVRQPAAVEGPVGERGRRVPRLAGPLAALLHAGPAPVRALAVHGPPAHAPSREPPVGVGLLEVGAGAEARAVQPAAEADLVLHDHLPSGRQRVEPGPEPPERRRRDDPRAEGHEEALHVRGDALGAGQAPEVHGLAGHRVEDVGVRLHRHVGVVADHDLVVRRQVARPVQPDLVAGEVVAVVGTLGELGVLAEPGAGLVGQVGGRHHEQPVHGRGQRLDLAPDVGSDPASVVVVGHHGQAAHPVHASEQRPPIRGAAAFTRM